MSAHPPRPPHALGRGRHNHWHAERERVDIGREAPPYRPIHLSAAPQHLTLDPARTSLVVIDMQNDFCAPGGWLDHIGVDFRPARRPIEPLNRLLPVARQHDIRVIWVNWGNRPDQANLPPGVIHVYNGDGQSVGLGDPLPGNGAPVLQKNSWAAAIVEELDTRAEDIYVDKYRMSGFWDTPLDSILRNLRTDTVLFAGVNADQCVLASLMDAACLGYDCILLEDCAATTSPDFCWQATLYNVRQCFGFSARGEDLVVALHQRGTP